jgi:hypothetical protein
MTEIDVKFPPEFVALCERDALTPAGVVEQFIRDLCSLPGSSGSDERLYAKLYYDRCGYTMDTETLIPDRLEPAAQTMACLTGIERPARPKRDD